MNFRLFCRDLLTEAGQQVGACEAGIGEKPKASGSSKQDTWQKIWGGAGLEHGKQKGLASVNMHALFDFFIF